MKKSIRSLFAMLAIGALALTARAEPALKIMVVDLGKIYDNHYKYQEQSAKMQADSDKAREYLDEMRKQGNALVDEYKNLKEQASNAALSADAKAKASADADKKMEEIQAKQNDINNFIQQTQGSLQNRMQTFKSMLVEEITKVAIDVAKRHGATILLDKFGPSMIGVSPVLYSDSSYDITDEVMAVINKDRPATAPTAPAAGAAPAAGTSSTSGSAAPATSGPTINLPIGQKK